MEMGLYGTQKMDARRGGRWSDRPRLSQDSDLIVDDYPAPKVLNYLLEDLQIL